MSNIKKIKNYLPLPPGPPLFVVEKEKFTPIEKGDKMLKWYLQ
jgi:hypothetical protein